MSYDLNVVCNAIRQIRSLEAEKNEIQGHLVKYLQHTSIDFETRWKLYEHLQSEDLNKCTDCPDDISKVFREHGKDFYSDFHISRYQTVDLVELALDQEHNIREFPEYYSEEDIAFNKALIVAIVECGFGSFINDW